MELTAEQQSALDAILSWYHGLLPEEPLTLGGYAGVGKTTLLGHLEKAIAIRDGGIIRRKPEIVFCSYTGKAVSVLRRKLPRGTNCMTLHRLLYRPRQLEVCAETDELLMSELYDGDEWARKCDTHKAGKEPCTVKRKVDFTPNPRPLDGIDLVVVDEASMVSEQIWHDLTRHGVPVLAVGDHGQLPPIKSDFNLMANPEIRLEKILRQAADNPIIKMATLARLNGKIPIGDYGKNCVKFPPFKRMAAVQKLHPEKGDLALCAMNRTRVDLNDKLRNQMLGVKRGEPPQPGDIVICLRNNYEAGVFNGMRGRIISYSPPDDTDPYAIFRSPSAMAEIEILDDDYAYRGEISVEQFREQKTLSQTPRSLGLWDYGYGMTVHKAQGSEADRVLVIEETLPHTEHNRWLYTAVTRAARSLCVVGPAR